MDIDHDEPNWFCPSTMAPLPRTSILPPSVKDHPRARPEFSCSGPLRLPELAPTVRGFFAPFLLIVVLMLGAFSGWLFGWPAVSFLN